MDIGLPHNYLLGTQLFLQHLFELHQNNESIQGTGESTGTGKASSPYKVFDGETSINMSLAEGPNIIGSVLIHPSA